MKTILFVLLINVLVNSAIADDFTNSTNSNSSNVELQLHFLPDFLSVTGQAQVNIPNEQVKISISIETTNDKASDTLKNNNDKMNNAINNLKLLGLKKSEFSTSGFEISENIPTVYNSTNNTYTDVFQGYKVKNQIVISTQKLDLVGQIIDITASGGINKIDSFTYTPLESTITASKQKLLALATNNAARQANTVLTELGYEIKAVKSVNLNDSGNNPPMYGFSNITNSTDSSSNNALSGETNLQASVTVQFIIGKKEQHSNE